MLVDIPFSYLKEINEKKYNQYKETLKHCCYDPSTRKYAKLYLNALKTNDMAVIEDFESFGNLLHIMVRNKLSYDRQLLFGFNRKEFDRHGSLIRPTFINCEQFSFGQTEKEYCETSITVGQGLNRVWTYGMCIGLGDCSWVTEINVSGKRFNSRKACLIAALKEVLKEHANNKREVELSKEVKQEVEKFMDKICQKEAVQLQLF